MINHEKNLAMKKFVGLIGALLLLAYLSSCSNQTSFPVQVEELSPWCILGFDSLDRTPTERIAMLKEMGFTKYGYNRGKGVFDEMEEEFKLAKENGIEINAVFLWLNAQRDSIGKLSPSNKDLLNKLKNVEYKPTIWLSFSDNFFKERSQESSIKFSIAMIQSIKTIADDIGCNLAIYNHHGWFGNPHHQVKILESLNEPSIGMVYNFHHAHEYVDEFPQVVKKMMPYLTYVNLNGVKKEGPQILPIGEGDYEQGMIQELMRQGYDGPWGILGHIKTDDVQKVLERNLKGLNLLYNKHASK